MVGMTIAVLRKKGNTTRGRFPASPDEELWAGKTFERESLFGRRASLEVEVGTGKARFLIESARAAPERDFLGLERSLSYYRVCRDRLARTGLPNARILRADARLFVEGALSPDSVAAFHVYFPDPWPKKKHRKRRLLDGVFLELLASRLEPGGLLRIATDHADYGSSLGALLATVEGLQRQEWDAFPPPPPTHYELKYRAEGRPMWRFLRVKRKA
jgi:tRNA (guanine-N7-)-methyltransferase